MAADNIDKLYQIYDVLSTAGDKISECEEEYLVLLEAVKGSDREKRLASQFIPKFFKHFPTLIDRSIESQFDLCEDEDILIRKQAVRDLPNFCRENKEFTKKISDILAQLLQVDDSGELSIVYSALMTLFKHEAKGTLAGLFNQILTGEDVVRDRSIKFLANKYKHLGPEIITKEAEDLVIAETKKVLQDVTADEFRLLMSVLGETRLGVSISGHAELVNLVAEQAELDQPFGTPEPENVDRLIACTRHALPYFSVSQSAHQCNGKSNTVKLEMMLTPHLPADCAVPKVESTRFVTYMCEEVLPVLGELPKPEDGPDTTLEILKLTAELCTNCGTLENPQNKLQAIFNKLLDYMPVPPLDETEQGMTEELKLEFSYVECLLYALHKLGSQCPEFLADNPDRLKDFRIRLQYFARGTQGYMKKLKELQSQSKEAAKTAEPSLQSVALKTTGNIVLLIKDLFHTPPSYKSVVNLSWVAPAVTKDNKKNSNGSLASLKRHTPITFGHDGHTPKQARTMDRTDRVIYQPPSGKYSEKISSYTAPRRGRGNRGRGNLFRGNRTWRNNY